MQLSINLQRFGNPCFKSKIIYEKSKIPLTSEEKDYINRFEENQTSDHRFLGEGVVSKAYYSPTHDFVIKHNKENQYVRQKDRTQWGSLAHENNILLQINPNVKTTQRGRAYVETEKGGMFLISSFVPGKSANYITNPFMEKHIDRLLRNLYRLDKSKIIHSDLSNPNLLLDSADNVNFIDYQWADTYDFARLERNYTLRNSVFPTFETPNNASMFEAAALAGYSRSMPLEQANKFLWKYYQNKTPYIEKNIHRLEKLKNNYGSLLDDAIEFEKSRAKAYSYFDEHILNAETHKMNILNLHRRQFSCYDLNKIKPRNILRAIPLCIKAKECAIALTKYDKGFSSDATYYSYMRKYGEFWQGKIDQWYLPALKWIFQLVSEKIKDPAKVYFPEKFDDFSHINIVKSSASYHVPRTFYYADLSLRDLFKSTNYQKKYYNYYENEAKVNKLLELVFRKQRIL